MKDKHRVLAAGLIFAALLAAALPGARAGSGRTRPADINADGHGDLAIGAPYHDLGTVSNSGSVYVLYGADDALSDEGSQYWHEWVVHGGEDESDDHFGSALAIGDFDGDGYGDLAVGMEHEDVGTIADAGAVSVLYGTGRVGLTAARSRIFTEADDGMDGFSEEGNYFGATLATGDFDADGYADLAIGVPGEDFETVADAGSVQVLYGSADGLDAPRSMVWFELDLQGEIEEGDRFGSALATGDFDGDGYDDLAVGIPDEDMKDATNAGAVTIAWGSADGMSARATNDYWHQERPGVPDTAEAGDRFGYTLAAGDVDGDGYDDLAIAAPFESLSGKNRGGVVHVLHGSDTGLAAPGEYWHQDSDGVGSLVEDDDYFGFALAFGDFEGDGFADLAVGVPFEDGNAPNCGIVQVFAGSAAGLTTPEQYWHQDTQNVDDVAEEDDLFGYALVAADFDHDGRDDLAIGVPYEDVVVDGTNVSNAGLVHVEYGGWAGLSPVRDQLWYQGHGVYGAPEQDSFFGLVLAAAQPSNLPIYLPLINRAE
jgi:hypothetical protein